MNSRSTSAPVSRATLLATSFGLAVVGQANDIIKLDNTSALNDGASWTNGAAPGSGDVAVWNSTVTAANATSLGADLSWSGIRIANPGGAVSINIGNTLTLGAAGIDMSAATQNLTLNNPVALGAVQNWSVGTSRTLAASGVVSGGGALTKTGAGQLTLGNANTFNSGFTISAGTVVAGNNAAFGTGTLALGGGALTTSGVRTFSNPVNVVAATTTNLFGYSGGGNYPILNGAITGSGTITNFNDGSRGGLGNGFINGDISAFTGTFSFNNTGSGNNFQFNSGTATSIDGSKANFVATGNASSSPGQWLFNNMGTAAFKMGSLSGTGGNITGNSTNLTFEVGALDTDTSFAGIIRQISGTTNLSKVGTGRLVLTGSNTYNGATTINNGTLGLTKDAALPGSVSLAASNTPTLQLTAPLFADNWTFTKQINGGSANAKVEKTGLGTVILTPAASSSFTGTVTASQGKLFLNNNNFATPAVSVGSGATFGGTGTAGAITATTGATVQGGHNGAGTLTAGSLTFSSTGNVSGSLSAGTTPIVITGALATSGGADSVSVTLVGGVPANGTYHLIQFGSLVGSLSHFKFPSPVRAMSLQQNGNFIDVAVNSNTFPVWTGGSSGEWSTNGGTGNWKLSSDGSATDFMALDNTVFDDSAPGSTDLVIGQTDLSPGIVTFNNSSRDYTLTQENGKDILNGSLVKTGSGKLTIDGGFSFSGGSTLSGGTVSIAGETALGTGIRTLDGGTLEYTGGTADWTRATVVNAPGGTFAVTDPNAVLTHAGSLSGSGVLTKSGAGTLLIPQTSGTLATPLAISGGTLGLNYGGGAVTSTASITGSSGILRLEGTGASATTGLTLTGNNTFTGQTHIYGRRIFLNNPGGNAIGGDILFKQSNWPYHDLSLSRSEQIADTAILRWDLPDAGAIYEFRLNGFTETVGGLQTSELGSAIIENAGYDGVNDNNVPAGKLIVNTATGTDYIYRGALRNQNGGTGNGALSFEKAGPGTQTLVGNFSYTGSTTVSGGKLVLQDPSNAITTFVSSGATLATGATLEFKNAGTWTSGVPISGGGNLIKSGAGTTVLTGTQSYTGTTTIVEGTLSFPGSTSSSSIDVQTTGTLGTTTAGTGTTVNGTGLLVGVTFASGSTLSPGTSTTIGTLNGDGTITFAAGAACVMNVDRTDGVITNDQLANMDAVSYGGTLTVMATGQAFQVGDVIDLFPGAFNYGGGFSTINLPTLGAGLSWDLSGLTLNGSIKVVNSAPTPVFNPPSGGYVGAQTVSISSASGTTIHYTMDGSTPTISSPSGPSPITGLVIPSNSNVVIKAFARKTDQTNSPIATAEYHTLDLPVWILDNNGSWQDSANWQNGVMAQGPGVIADFSTLATGGANTVYLDGPRTVGKLVFGDQGNQYEWTLAAGDGGSLTLNNGANTPVIDVVNQTTTIGAGITSGNGLRKEGAGTLNLTGTNAISGGFQVAAGTLNIGAPGAMGSGTSVTLGTGGAINPTFRVSTGTGYSFGSLTVPAGVTGATFALTQNAGTFNQTMAGATLGSPLTVAQSNTTGINWSQLIWNTKLTGNGGGSGNDTLVFNNTSATQNYFTMGAGVVNDFSGNVRSKGIVAAQSGSAGSNFMIPDASMLIIESGEWRWNQTGFVETIDGLAGAGSMINPGNVTLTINASNADNEGDRLFTGSLGTMAGAFTKGGSGTQSFSGTGITYTNPTTINGGTLELNGTTAFASSAVTVNGGKLRVNNATGSGTGTTATITVKSTATVAGTGSLGGTTTVEAGGTIAPGDASAGTLAASNVTLAGSYPCQLDGANGDRLTVTGTLVINPSATITVSILGTPTQSSYTILSYGSLVGTLPVITGVPSGYSVDTSTPGQVKLVGGNAFDSWINGFPSLTDPADRTQNADPDDDGLANILEFVLNSSPADGASANLPTLASSGANVVFTFTRRDDSESFNPTVEFDADLAGTWTTAVNGSNCTIVVTENGSNPDTVTVTIPKGSNPKLFTRLKVTP